MGRHRKLRPRPLRRSVEAEPETPVVPTSRRRRARTHRADDVVRRIDETLGENTPTER